MAPVNELSPIDYTGMLIGLAVAQGLWLIARRLHTFAQNESHLTLGAAGLVILPMRVIAKVASWGAALWVVALLITVVPEGYFNSAVAALFIGFFVAHAVNLFISRYEQAFIKKQKIGTGTSGFTS